MRTVRGARFLAVAVSAVVGLTACGGGSSSTGSSGATKGAASKSATSGSGGAAKLKVGLAYDIGGRGDKSFNDAAGAGLDKAKSSLGVEARELSARDNETDADKQARLQLLADGGYNPIVAVGFAYATALGKVAKTHPQTKFAIIDDATNKLPNVADLVFAEEQGSYLVGAAAALKSKSGNIGFVGGVQTPLIAKFQAGYAAGAKKVKPSVKVQVKYLTQPPDFNGFKDPAKGKAAAAGMFDNGADVVYQAAGASGGGVFQAAQSAKGMAIGVDSDQYKTADAGVRSVILTSMLKRVDVAVFDFVSMVAKGQFRAGEQRFDLKSNGVGYSTSGGALTDIAPRLEALKKQIVSGAITVPTAP